MKINILIILVIPSILVGCSGLHSTEFKDIKVQNEKLVDKVNPFIGTGGHGHTFPGACVPNGMVQLSPDTRLNGWDACSGYHSSDSVILGFSHTHLSGTGIGDYGDILFIPTSGKQKTDQGSNENPDSGYASRKKIGSEKASPGYYSVVLEDYDIKAELTTSLRAGFHRYIFRKNEPGMIIDLSHTLQGHKNVKNKLEVINNNEIRGVKITQGWARVHPVYFHAVFSAPFKVKLIENESKALITFDESLNEVLVKVGISSVDLEGAKGNLDAEIPGWGFDEVAENAEKMWEDYLNKIHVEGGSEDQKTIFYTALYHTGITPYLFSDVDGRYVGMDRKIHSSDQNVYTVFSLWDTFRAFHPLQTIIQPSKNQEMINSLLLKYNEGGVLPKWELAGNYTGTMIGYHSASVIVDAFMKGQRGFDVDQAYKAILESSSNNAGDIEFFDQKIHDKLMTKGKYFNETLGFLPADSVNESVSKALEYAYNDWCIAQMANELGQEHDFNKFHERSNRYKLYFDNETGFMRGKNANGEWREPFNPRYSNHRIDDYTEGNAWQWTWFVPHDIEGLMELMGGKDKFVAHLDKLFAESSEIEGDNSSMDITGLIGQYAHGNEPSHHIAYLYNYVGLPHKTQQIVTSILDNLYFNDPDGLSGNEDCGQMSAWYVMSAMGIYQVAPGNPTYTIGKPIFDKVSISLENGQTFEIIKSDPENTAYINEFIWNDNSLGEPFITHDKIESGGILKLK